MCSCRAITGMSHDTLKWKLFPFSLIERAKQWYMHTVGSVNRSWDELRDKFCISFPAQSRIVSLRRDVFYFQQNEKESIGAAWARFSLLLILALTCRYPIMCCFNIFTLVSTWNPAFTLTLLLEDPFPITLHSKVRKFKVISHKTPPSFLTSDPPKKSIRQAMRSF